MNVLITGGAGFIGSRLERKLAAEGASVVLFDSLHPQVHADSIDLNAGATLFAGDVRDADAWDRCLRLHGAPDVVVHLAAETGTGQSLNEATRHGSTNVCGTTEMTDALVRHGVMPAQIVLASSRAVYGEGSWVDDKGIIWYPGPRTGAQLERAQWDPLSPSGEIGHSIRHAAATVEARPSNVYAATKLAQEHILDAWCSAYGVPLSILRLQNVYGPGQAVGNSYTGVLTFFARQVAAGEQVEVFEDGDIVRDFVFVDDVVSALAAAAAAPPEVSRRVDIGSGAPTTLIEVASTMCAIGSAPTPQITGAYRLGDVRAAAADISAAQVQLDWTPTTDLATGLTALLDWVPTQL